MNKYENVSCVQQSDLFLTDKCPKHWLTPCQINVSSPNNILTIKAIEKVPHTKGDFEKTEMWPSPPPPQKNKNLHLIIFKYVQ